MTDDQTTAGSVTDLNCRDKAHVWGSLTIIDTFMLILLRRGHVHFLQIKSRAFGAVAEVQSRGVILAGSILLPASDLL